MKEAVYKELIKKYPGTEHLFERYLLADGNIAYRYKAHFKLPKADRDLSKVHENLKKTWLALGAPSFNSFGKKGLVNGVPISAHNVSVAMKGKQFKQTELDLAVEKLREKLKAFRFPVLRQSVQQET